MHDDDPHDPAPTPFGPAGDLATPHGIAAMTHLPDAGDPVPDAVLAQLPGPEVDHARTLGGFRQVSFVGGRLALHAAMRHIGAPDVPVLPDPRGTPALPGDWTASVSHKRTLAIAMVGRGPAGTLGIDLENLAPARLGIAERVLRPAEQAAIASLPPDRAWIGLLLRFSTKEAIYKALDPYVRRWVGFEEAEVTPGRDGLTDVTLHLAHAEGPFFVDARYRWLPGHVLTTVRIRRVGAPRASAPEPPAAG